MALSEEEESAPSSSPTLLLRNYLPLVSQPLSSTTRTFTNLFLCIVGSGVLGLPYTFSNVGYVMGLLTLILGAAVSYHGMMLQIYAKHRLCRSHGELDLIIASYGDLVYHAFGSWARFSVDVLITLATLAAAIAHITSISQNLASIATSIQGTHIQGMQLHGSYSSSRISTGGMQSVPTAIPCVGILNSTRNNRLPYLEIDSAKSPDVRNTSRTAYEDCVFSGYINHNQSSFKLGIEKQSSQEPSSLGSVSANMSFSAGSLTQEYLGGINWSSSTTFTWCSFPIIVALGAIPSITLLAPLSTLGNTLNFAALAAVMVSDVLEVKSMSGFQNMKRFGDMVAVPSAFGVAVYAFQSSGIMIPIETSMEQPFKLGSVLGLVFILSGILYAIFAVLGYAAFGTNTQQVITLNLQTGIEAVLIKTAISLSMFAAFPLLLTPMFELVERRFSRRKVSLALRTLVVFVICLVASMVKQFADFLSLSGSSISCLLGFILPAAVHIKVMKEDGENPPTFLLYVADYVLIVFGLIFGAFGTIVSFLEFF